MPAVPPPPPDDAPAVRRLGYALRKRREAMPGVRNRQQLAELLEYSWEVVRDVENGRYGARLQRFMTRWEERIGLNPELEDLWRQVQAESMGAADGRLGSALRHPTTVDLVTVADLRQQVQDLDMRYEYEPSTVLLADTGRCLSQVRFLQAHAAAGRVRRELSTVAAEAAILMGQLVWDASQRRDNATAHVYFDQAITAAQQANDPATEGLAWLRKTFVALYGERDPHAGLGLAEHAARTTEATSSVLTGLAVLHGGEAHAMLGQRRACEHALGHAESAFGQIAATDAAFELFSPTQLGRVAGSCYLLLGEARRAEQVLETTAAEYPAASKSQAILLANLTLACLAEGKLDDGAARLHQAIDVVEQTWGGGGFTLVFRAAKELRPWRQTPVVQDVSDRLLSLIATA